jgi:hypothetical protein
MESEFGRGFILGMGATFLLLLFLFNMHHIFDGIDAIRDRIWVWRHQKGDK